MAVVTAEWSNAWEAAVKVALAVQAESMAKNHGTSEKNEFH